MGRGQHEHTFATMLRTAVIIMLSGIYVNSLTTVKLNVIKTSLVDHLPRNKQCDPPCFHMYIHDICAVINIVYHSNNYCGMKASRFILYVAVYWFRTDTRYIRATTS